MSSACLRWFLVLVSLASQLGALPPSTVELQLGDAQPTGGSVQFGTPISESVDSLPITSAKEDIQVGTTQHYKILTRLDDISVSNNGFIHYRFYVSPKGVAGGLMSFLVSGEPRGSFQAQTIPVNFYVIDASGTQESGTISLPVFTSESDYLAAPRGPDAPDAEPVDISGTTPIKIPLQNLQKWTVSVKGIQQPIQSDLWYKAELLVNGSTEFKEFEVPPLANGDMLVLHLEPNRAHALAEALFSRVSKKKPQTVTAVLNYTSRFGASRSLEIKVPIKFVPWPPFLFLGVLAGTLLGSAIPVMADQRPKEQWLHAFGASFLTAVLAELLAMFLVSHESEFRFLGFNLDPYQLLPAALIGALMGLLGFASLEALKRMIAHLGGGEVAGSGSKKT